MSYSDEPLCQEHKLSVVVRPDLENLFSEEFGTMWVPGEIQFDKDMLEWPKLDEDERQYIRYILAFSTVADQLVNENLGIGVINIVKDPSLLKFIHFQIAMEFIHAVTYDAMLRLVETDAKIVAMLDDPRKNFPAIERKAAWIESMAVEGLSLGKRFVVQAIMERIMFSSLFLAFYWLKQAHPNCLGLVKANKMISKDENLHGKASIQALKYVKHLITEAECLKLIEEAVDIELQFVRDSLVKNLSGINASIATNYVKFIANRTAKQLRVVEGFCREPYTGLCDIPNWATDQGCEEEEDFFISGGLDYNKGAKSVKGWGNPDIEI
jgi:ribonucleotide reductase beta subunit family protein with ferritin-like domain